MKRFLLAALFAAMLALFAACGVLNANSAAVQETATPTGSTSRTQRSEPVKVNETAAKVDVVEANSENVSDTAASSEGESASGAEATDTEGEAAEVESEAQEASEATASADTPATGDIPIVYLAFAVGLILICSAGLLMLRRI